MGSQFPRIILSQVFEHISYLVKKEEEVKLNENFSLSLQHSLFLLVTLVFFN